MKTSKLKKFKIVKESLLIDDKECATYGIKCSTNVIHDISTDYGFVYSIVKVLNENCVSEIHLQDVVEDFLK